MKRASAVLVALLGLAHVARGQVVPIEWDASGQFARKLDIAPSKFVELCEKLKPGTKVRWRYETSSPLNFNIHYHEGKDVRFPEKEDASLGAQGVLDAVSEQDYCWMWSNKTQAPVGVNVNLSRQ